MDNEEIKNCSGCSACANICPENCIEMKPNNKGFIFPVVNSRLCINCNLCKKVCPFLENTKIKNKNISFAAATKDINVLKNSSSGGIFYELAYKTIKNNGVVVGASFSGDYRKVKHIFVDNISDLKKLQTSKYIQSEIRNIFLQTKQFLDNDHFVLFSGTPCQISGLKKYLGKNYKNLLCVEIICRGVPSPKIWNKYLDYIEKKNKERITYFNFRNKRNGWKQYSVLWETKTKKKHSLFFDNEYMKLFLSNLSIRPSCLNCKVKENGSYADIILGDFWGINNIIPNVKFYNGVSAIVLNTQNGLNHFNEIKNNIDYYEVKYNDIINNNKAIVSSAEKPSKYDEFMEDLIYNDFDFLINKYINKHTFKHDIKKFKKYINIYKDKLFNKIQH